MEFKNLWKTACDPKINGGLPIPSVKKLFTAPTMELSLFHGGGTISTDIMPLGAHTAILGSTGMGKSNAVGLLIEKIHQAIEPETGGCVIPIFIADFQGEYSSIFDLFPDNVHFITEIIESERTVETKKGGLRKVYTTFGKRDAKEFVNGRTTFHFNMTSYISKMGVAKQYLHEFLLECYNLKTEEYERLKKENRKPRAHLFWFSEAHNFFPEITPWTEREDDYARALKDDGTMIVRGGRKIGMPLGIDSQRPSQMDKDLTSQCLNRFLLPVIDRPDIEYYLALLPKVNWGELSRRMADMRLPQNRGEAFVRLITTGAFLDVRRFYRKESKDMGGTPDLASSLGWEYGGKGQDKEQPDEKPHPSTTDNPYEILQIDKSASNKQIKEAYRRQLRAWHPDHHMLDEEGPEFANEMMKKINAAYDRIRRERGLK